MNRFVAALSAACVALGTAGASAQPAQTPAAVTPAPDHPGVKVLEEIFRCLAAGLSEDWKRAWIEVREIERTVQGTLRRYEASFLASNREDDRSGDPVVPCASEPVIEGITELNRYLPEPQRRWTAATFTFFRDGRFEVKYDYDSPGAVLPPEEPKPAPEKPAAAAQPKPAPKKK
jgi:hypothetical protein